MYSRIIIVFSFLLLNHSAFSQLLKIDPTLLFEKWPIFNEAYIKENKIKRITFDIIDKKDLQEAIDRNLVEVYEFNTQGLLTRNYHTQIKRTIQEEIRNKKNNVVSIKSTFEYDTISYEYAYNSNNDLITTKYHSQNYHEGSYFRYQNHNLTREERYIENYRTLINGQMILDKLSLKYYDSIYTFKTDKQTKQVFYNNEKMPYKETFYYKADDGKLLETSEYLSVANGKIKKHFNYSKNMVQDATMVVDYGNPKQTIINFTYDTNNQLYSEKHTIDNKDYKEIQYIYQEDGSLKSILIRSFDEKNIRIIKIYYEFY